MGDAVEAGEQLRVGPAVQAAGAGVVSVHAPPERGGPVEAGAVGDAGQQAGGVAVAAEVVGDPLGGVPAGGGGPLVEEAEPFAEEAFALAVGHRQQVGGRWLKTPRTRRARGGGRAVRGAGGGWFVGVAQAALRSSATAMARRMIWTAMVARSAS